MRHAHHGGDLEVALQADLLSPARFAEACSAWAGRKDALPADLLVERRWTILDRVERRLSARLARLRS
jgi:hypothetical protein